MTSESEILVKNETKILLYIFGSRMRPPKTDKLREGGLNTPWDLEKWKMSVFPCFTTRPHLVSREDTTL